MTYNVSGNPSSFGYGSVMDLAHLAQMHLHQGRAGCFKYALVIRSPFRRQGYARAAIVLLLRHYFRERRYQKCTVIIYSFNTASIRLHDALGFSLEGRLRRMVFTNYRHYDALYYGMTAEEFVALDPPPALPDAG